MDDIELFKELSAQADAGNIRAVTYPVIPRGLHTITVKSAKLDKRDDSSRFIVLVGEITDDSPENGQEFRSQAMLLTKDGKKITQGMAFAAGIIAAAKASSIALSPTFGNATGAKGVCWLDVDSYQSKGNTVFTQQVCWGSEEPPKTSKPAATTTASPTGDQPPF